MKTLHLVHIVESYFVSIVSGKCMLLCLLIFISTMGNYECIVLCLVVPAGYLFTTFVHDWSE